jgi:RIO kinase 1
LTRIYEGGRPVPPGIILEDYIEDVELGMLKRGKEAEVFLVERRARDRSCLFAEKRYFAFEERTFKHNAGYREHQRAQGWARDGGRIRKRKGGGGTQRAIARGTDYGKRTLYATWQSTEWTMLTQLWNVGAPVPFPVEQTADGMLMEYIGDREMAAPRLAQAGVSKGELSPLFGQFREGLRAFARAGIVHGDLSPYNLLVWDGELWFIDLPQAVPYLQNKNATDFLYRDVTNVCDWFMRRGLEVDAEEVFAEAMSELFEFRMTDLFVARD